MIVFSLTKCASFWFLKLYEVFFRIASSNPAFYAISHTIIHAGCLMYGSFQPNTSYDFRNVVFLLIPVIAHLDLFIDHLSQTCAYQSEIPTAPPVQNNNIKKLIHKTCMHYALKLISYAKKILRLPKYISYLRQFLISHDFFHWPLDYLKSNKHRPLCWHHSQRHIKQQQKVVVFFYLKWFLYIQAACLRYVERQLYY